MGIIKPGEPGTVASIVHPCRGRARRGQDAPADLQAPRRDPRDLPLHLAQRGDARGPRPDPKARHGQGAHFYPQVPFWPDPALIRNDPAAVGVPNDGKAPAIVVTSTAP